MCKWNDRKKSKELGELSVLEPVSLMIKKSRLNIKMILIESGIVGRWQLKESVRGDARKRPGGIVLRMTWKV